VLLRLPGPHHTHSLRLGFLLFVFFLSFSFSSSFFLFFCYCLVDTLLQNPLWMPDLFNEGRCFSCASTAAFIRSMFFPLPFLAADSIFAAGSMCRIPMFYFPSFFCLVPDSHHHVLPRTLHLGLSLYISFLFFPVVSADSTLHVGSIRSSHGSGEGQHF
jgi:hypothetical protein